MQLGPMLDALRAPPVPPGRDMQVSEDLFMDLDAPSLKRSSDTPSSTHNRLISPMQMSLRRELKPPVFRCQELLSQSFWLQKHLFSQCHIRDTTVVSHQRSDAFDAIITKFLQEEKPRP